jgi:hypothetical protein
MSSEVGQTPASAYVAWLADVEHALVVAHEEAAAEPAPAAPGEADDEPHGSEAEPEP